MCLFVPGGLEGGVFNRSMRCYEMLKRLTTSVANGYPEILECEGLGIGRPGAT